MAEHKTQTEAPTDGPLTDHAEAARLLRLIAGDGPVTFQTFDESGQAKRKKLAKILHGTLQQKGVRLDGLNSDGAGVFFMVNEGNLRGRQAHNVKRVRAVFADLDGAPLDPVLACELPPHAVVETSPGRFHAYWRADNVPLEMFKPLQQAIASRFGSDPKVSDPNRVMRLPGFFHAKSGVRFMSRIVEMRADAPYGAESLVAAFPIDLSRQAAPTKRKRYRIGEPIREGGRNVTLYGIARKMVNNGYRGSESYKRLLKANAAWCEPPLPESEVAAILDSAYNTPPDAKPQAPMALMLSPSVRKLSNGAFRLLAHAVWQSTNVPNGQIEIDPAQLSDCMSLKHGYKYRRELLAAGLIVATRDATYNDSGRECSLFQIVGLPEKWGPD